MRFARLGFGGLSLALALSATAVAQAPAPAASASSASSEPTPLARYIPKDGLAIYIESAGLNSQGEAWKKTAAYKMLNDTPLGYMLEDIGAQYFDLLMRPVGVRKVTGAEVVTLLKYLVHHGYVLAINVDGPNKDLRIHFVARDGAAKEIRPIASRFLGLFMGPFKKELVKKGGRNVVVVSKPKTGDWAWWAEKDDVAVTLGQSADAEQVIEALDGKRPSAVDHPTRAALQKSTEEEFIPYVHAFVDATAFQGSKTKMAEFFNNAVTILGIARVQTQRGFHGQALMNVTKVVAVKPFKGLFVSFGDKTFEKNALPPMPDGLDGFTILSIDAPKSYAALSAYLKKESPDVESKVTEWVDNIKAKSNIDFSKDILAHLGPKIGFYVAPAKTAGTARKADESAQRTEGVSPLMNFLGGASVPKIVIIIDVDNVTALGKKLDELMIAVNRNFREMALSSAKAAESSETDQGKADGSGGNRPRRNTKVPAFEFQAAGGSSKAWFFSIPAEMGRLPREIRPTIRLGAKHLVIAINAEEARKALELKETTWQPSGDLAEVVAKLPSKMVYLALEDPRDSMPILLASLPGIFQAAVNTALARRQGTAAGGQPGQGAMAGPPGAGGMPGPGMNGPPGQGGLSATGPAGFAGRGPGATGPPGGGGLSATGPPGFASGGAPAGGAAGGAGAGGGSADGTFTLDIDKSRMPKPADLARHLFPSSLAVTLDDEGLKVVIREAFPEIVSRDSLMSSMIQPYIAKALKSLGLSATGEADAGQTPAAGAPASGPPAGAPGAGPPAAGGPGAPGAPGARPPGAPGPPK